MPNTSKPTNTAFVILRPDIASSPAVLAHFEALCDHHRIRKERSGSILCTDIHKRQLFDRYFSVAEQHATRVLPSHLRLSLEERVTFKKRFGIEWTDATAKDLVLNAQQYIHDVAGRSRRLREASPSPNASSPVSPPVLDEISGEADEAAAVSSLAEACLEARCKCLVLTLNDSITIHQLDDPRDVPSADEDRAPVFVINGEFPLQKGIFVNTKQEGAKVVWYTLAWRCQDLTWKDFNSKVMGSWPLPAEAGEEAAVVTAASDPEPSPEEKSEQDAIRLKRSFCDALQVDAVNAFGLSDETQRHIMGSVLYSTGPLHSFSSILTWLQVEIPTTLFGLNAMQWGISQPTLKDLAKNPTIHVRGNLGLAFDLTKGFDTDATLSLLAEYAAEEAALPVLNTALIFIKPHANTPKTRALVERMVADNEIRIVVEGRLNAEAIKKNNIIVRHYSVIAKNALILIGKQLADEVATNSKQAFQTAFGEELDAVCAEGRVLSAKEAMEGGLRDGEAISADRLAMLWKLCSKVTKIAPGMYVGYSKDERRYIINGFFPLIAEKFTAEGASVQYYLVSWPEDKLSWSDFRGKIIGPTDPSKAPTGSMREAILANWRDLGLLDRPNSSDNGVHASAGPLEGLAERLIWIGGSGGIESDVLTRVGTERGITTSYCLGEWVSNPTLTGLGITLPNGQPLSDGPIFDLTEDMQTSAFVEVLRQAEVAEAAARKRNHALIFVKPHAVTKEVKSVVETILTACGITINRQGSTEAEVIADRRLVDRHYSVIAKYAMTTAEDLLRARRGGSVAPEAEDQLAAEAAETTAMSLMDHPGEAGVTAFEKAFGVSWAEAVKRRSIRTAQEALELLDMSPMQLAKKWRNKDLCPTTIRVAPGLYVGYFVKEGLYIINGFYPLNREKFTTPGRQIVWYAVSWAEDRLTWADFRAKVIGPTDPTKAPDGSMRAVILKEWAQLGLAACPDVSDNGVHASAGPLEGLAERAIWLSNANPKTPSMATVIEKDPFGAQLRATKLPVSFIESCMANPTFTDTGKPLFDVLEDKQSSEALTYLKGLHQASADEFTLNRAVLLMRPTTATPGAVEAAVGAFMNASMTVDLKEMVLSGTYNARAPALEAPQIPAREVILSKEAKEKFHVQFGEEWDVVVAKGKVHTADAAAELLRATYSELTPEERYKSSDKTFDVASRWRQASIEHNVLFLPTTSLSASTTADDKKAAKGAVSASPTIEVGYDPAFDWYVLNGGACNTAFSAKEGLGCMLLASWASDRTSYSDALAQVVGAVEATESPEESIRGMIYRKWSDLGLGEAPASNDTGVKVSAGPLQALFQRCVWQAVADDDAAATANPSAKPPKPIHPKFTVNITAQLRRDPLGKELLNNGVPVEILQYILYCNPAVSLGVGGGLLRREGPVLDLLAHHDTQTVANAIVGATPQLETLWTAELASLNDNEQAPRTLAIASQLSLAPNRASRDAESAISAATSRVAKSRHAARNQALVFIKPHAASSPAVALLVEAKLQEHFIRIDAEGSISSEAIAEGRLIDSHYAAIALYALRASASEIGATVLTDATRAKFEATFGEGWASATRDGRILNAAAAMDNYALTAKMLSDMFAAATTKMKLAPGLYVAKLAPLNNVIVINGFYPLNREKFTTPGRQIVWYAVSWAEDRLTWADFRAKVIGPTDPTKAPDGSMRAVILKEWAQLGLAACPDVSDNGVHASAGPLEGVAERIIWTNATLRQLAFSRDLMTKRGVTERFLQRCLSNPSMEVDTEPVMVKAGPTTELKKGADESVVLHHRLALLTASEGSAPSASIAAYSTNAIRTGPLFDILEDTQTSKALDIVQRLFETDRTGNMQNTALVFIKPHAQTPLATAFVEAAFRENQFDVISQGSVMSDDLVARGLLDKHYSTIATYALDWRNDAQRKAEADECHDEKLLAELEKPNPILDAVRKETGDDGYQAKLDEFSSAFGVTLETALRKGVLLGAASAIEHMAAFEESTNSKRNKVTAKKYDDRHQEMTPAKDLFKRWSAATKFVKLASGVYAKQISLIEDSMEAEKAAQALNAQLKAGEASEGALVAPVAVATLHLNTFIVINGFYPKLKESYTSVPHGPAITWYVLSWPERKLSWADFRGKFIGPTNPLQAPTGSLRGGMYTNWRDLGLSAKPDTTDNGVHASAGPLEALVERLIWTTPAQTVTSSGLVTDNHINLSDPDTISPWLHKDALACVLMEHELAASDIARMCSNPTVLAHGVSKPVFVHTEDMQSSLLAPFLRQTLLEEAEAKKKQDEDLEREAKRQAELLLFAQAEEVQLARSQPMNTAFVFIKPHAVTQATKDLVEASFLQKGITIKTKGGFTHNEVARVIDQHYGIVSTYATLKPVHHIVLSDEVKELFKGLTDGKEDWEQAVAVGHVQNAADAMKELGDLTPAMLARRWDDAPRKVKLAPGMYVGYLPNDDIFVVNGFYPRIREKYTTSGSSIYYYVVEWPEEVLSWKEFRAGTIGPTDPSKAPEDSIRGAIYKNWRHLGLEKQSNMADNGVHASAGPVEGLVERCVWLRLLPQIDPFGQMVVGKRSVPVEFFHKWTRNEQVTVSPSLSGQAFDLTEDLQSSAAANLIADALAYSEMELIPTRKVALVPKRTLFEASLRDYFINLNSMSSLADFERLFQYYDRAGTGLISREEFYVDYNRFECYGQPLDAGKVEELFTKYDFSKDGKMNFDEFSILMLERVAHM